MLKLLQSYLTERKQFINLQNDSSITRDMPNSSVIQGSRLSGLLYVCYVNEINDLHKLMSKQIYTTITDRHTKIYTDIEHDTISFVDDSTNIVSSTGHTNLQSYLTDYHVLLSKFYSSNMLKINHDKTQMLISCKKRFRPLTDNLTFDAGGNVIKQQNFITILGFSIQNT